MTKSPRITPQMIHSYIRQRSQADPVRYQQELEKLIFEMERIQREHDRRASHELAKRIFHAVTKN